MKDKINELEMHRKKKKVRELRHRISEFKEAPI
jgi:hypothetical protein